MADLRRGFSFSSSGKYLYSERDYENRYFPGLFDLRNEIGENPFMKLQQVDG